MDAASFWNGLTLDKRDQLFVQRNYPEAPDEMLCDCDNHDIEYEKLDDWHKEKIAKEIQILEYEKYLENHQV